MRRDHDSCAKSEDEGRAIVNNRQQNIRNGSFIVGNMSVNQYGKARILQRSNESGEECYARRDLSNQKRLVYCVSPFSNNSEAVQCRNSQSGGKVPVRATASRKLIDLDS